MLILEYFFWCAPFGYLFSISFQWICNRKHCLHPSSIRRDSNPQPIGREPYTLTTRPWLVVLILSTFTWMKWRPLSKPLNFRTWNRCFLKLLLYETFSDWNVSINIFRRKGPLQTKAFNFSKNQHQKQFPKNNINWHLNVMQL